MWTNRANERGLSCRWLRVSDLAKPCHMRRQDSLTSSGKTDNML
jgi:hypothetical protein